MTSDSSIALPLFRQSTRSPDTSAPKRISILGATGSIGDSTLEVLRQHPERFAVVALVGGRNVQRMIDLAGELHPQVIAMQDEPSALAVADALPGQQVLSGQQGVIEAASVPADLSVAAITGVAGLKPTLAAIEAGNDIALANKESMVCAGPFVLEAAKRAGVNILPIDSEHSALFQCLMGQDLSAVRAMVLTASGGPFRALSPTELSSVTVDQALAHPTWSMGGKVTIDSATLMNKGLELIEAKWLFNAKATQLDAVIHPGSVVHSFVQFYDGSFLSQIGVPTMITPISVALGWPNRLNMQQHPVSEGLGQPDTAIATWSGLQFWPVDHDQFPCFKLAKQAMSEGIGACVVLNAANEIAVEQFLAGKLSFVDIAGHVERSLETANAENRLNVSALEQVLALDHWARTV